MSKHPFALLLAIYLLSACSSHPDSAAQRGATEQAPADSTRLVAAAGQPSTISDGNMNAADPVAYSSDSLQYLARESFELLSYRTTPDTLQLISTSPFLFYPFGKHATVTSFKKQYPAFVLKRKTDAFDASAVLYRGTAANDFVKLFMDDEKKTLEIVSGKVLGPELHLINGIAVGMSERAFFKLFFKQPSIIEKSGARVVELISGLDGIQHYYVFQSGVLMRIEFDTNYQFNKK